MNNKSDYFLWRKHQNKHKKEKAALICLSNLYLSVNDEIIAKQS